MSEKDLKILKSEFPDKWTYLNKRPVYPYEQFSNIEDYQNSVEKLRKKPSLFTLKKDYPKDEKNNKQTIY